jgi:hypothetical protein
MEEEEGCIGDRSSVKTGVGGLRTEPIYVSRK